MIVYNKRGPDFEATDPHCVSDVFAVWVEHAAGKGKCSSGMLVHLAAGDDGHWSHIDSFDSTWLLAIINAMQVAQREIDFANKRRVRKSRKGGKKKGR